MNIEIIGQAAKLENYNARAENSGPDEHVPACDLKIAFHTSADFLDQLEPGLKAMFYRDGKPGEGDLADQAVGAPVLNTQKLAMPLGWNDEMSPAVVHIVAQGHGVDLTIKDAKVNNVTVSTLQGGTVHATLRVQAHPDAEQRAGLTALVKEDIVFSVEAPESPQGNV